MFVKQLSILSLFAAGLSAATLQSFWMFEDSPAGTTAQDSVGPNNGTLSNTGASFVSGQGLNNSGALSLNRALNGYVNMFNVFNFGSPSATDFSVQAWVKTTTSAGDLVVARHDAGYSNGYFIALNNSGDGCSSADTVHFYAGYPCSGTAPGVSDGQWHQLVGVFEAGTAKIYVDGQLKNQSNGTTALLPSPGNFMVGGILISGTNTGTYTGLVDDVAVWSGALTDQEVLDQYNLNAAATPEPGAFSMLLGGALLFAVLGWYRRRPNAC